MTQRNVKILNKSIFKKILYIKRIYKYISLIIIYLFLFTVEVTSLSPERVHACPMRDRTESMPFQTYMNCIWFNI
jgi:hypothetical protein